MQSVNYYISQLQNNSDSEGEGNPPINIQNMDDDGNDEEEEQAIYSIPKPTQLQQSKAITSGTEIEQKDFRNKNSRANQPNQNASSYKDLNKQYIPDSEAYKLVDDILNKKR